MLLLHENREESSDPTQNTNTALYSNSNPSGKSKNKWNKNRNNNRNTSKGGGNSSYTTSANHVAGTQPNQASQFAGIMGSYPNGVAHNQLSYLPYGHMHAPVQHNNPWMQQNSATGPLLHHLPAAGSFPSHQAPFSAQQPTAPPHGAPHQHAAFFGQPISATSKPPLPQQSYFQQGPVTSQVHQPTDLASIYQAMSIQPPPDNNYYMDTELART